MEKETVSEHSDGVFVIFEEEDNDFQNVFATKKHEFKAESSKQPKHNEESLPHHSLPKIHFPKFDGSNPKIWFDIAVTISPSIPSLRD
jgi:hypothetical protein